MANDTSHTSALPELSLTEWVVLSVLAEAPAHGFAIAKQLSDGSDLGRILTVQRPLVYRALERLVSAEVAEAHRTEPGASGPTRTLHRATNTGLAAVGDWLNRPVGHVRDLRIEFLVKLRLQQRRSLSSASLVTDQREALLETLDGLTTGSGGDVVEQWRYHNAVAARDFLDDLML